MEAYLKATGREDLAKLANENRDLLTADEEVLKEPEKYFDRVIEINLSTLEPHVVGPHTPDLARPISKMSEDAKKNQYPMNLTFALIGSCTNSSYEDMSRAVDIARQAKQKGAKVSVPLMISPGSEQIYQTILRDGLVQDFEAIGAVVLANACGPCIGQWKRDDIKPGERNSIITSFNRNFPARNDTNPETYAFIGSPEVVVAYALSGSFEVDPTKEEFTTKGGIKLKLETPKVASELPQSGFVKSRQGYIAPPEDGSKVEIEVSPTSQRLQLLKPFDQWDGKDFIKLPILLKVKGKCTTDHISPAGPWLKYRGHLDNISNNMFTGAVNAWTTEIGKTKNPLTGQVEPIPQVARELKAQGQRWVVIGDENYGEGSSREHAAMSPRHLGAAAIIAKSFARIHETNLKKQGLLPFTFSNPSDYDKIKEGDKISILGLKDLKPNTQVKCEIHHLDGTSETIMLNHSMTSEQIKWFHAGSALAAAR
jgi:aconitate hydratase